MHHTVNTERNMTTLWWCNRKVEEAIFRRGLNFALAPHRIPTLEMAAAVEGVARWMNELEASELHVSVCSVLKRSKLPLSNIIKAESVVVSFFVILPEDKGNATVVMDSSAYEGLAEKATQWQCLWEGEERSHSSKRERRSERSQTVGTGRTCTHWAGQMTKAQC